MTLQGPRINQRLGSLGSAGVSEIDKHRAIIDSMAQLIVRNLDDDILKRLRRRAAESGRSVEAEHREILREALVGKRKSLKEHLLHMPDTGRDEDFLRKRDKGRKVTL
jgi:plasmid stability protein